MPPGAPVSPPEQGCKDPTEEKTRAAEGIIEFMAKVERNWAGF